MHLSPNRLMGISQDRIAHDHPTIGTIGQDTTAALEVKRQTGSHDRDRDHSQDNPHLLQPSSIKHVWQNRQSDNALSAFFTGLFPDEAQFLNAIEQCRPGFRIGKRIDLELFCWWYARHHQIPLTPVYRVATNLQRKGLLAIADGQAWLVWQVACGKYRPDDPARLHPSTFSNDLKQASKRSAGKCVYCGRNARVSTMDHAVPRARGGATNDRNVVLACNSCNIAKGDLTPQEWALSILQYKTRIEVAKRRRKRPGRTQRPGHGLIGLLIRHRDTLPVIARQLTAAIMTMTVMLVVAMAGKGGAR